MESPEASRFGEVIEPHRRELHVHCYRMLASFHEADDAVQETFLKAWRHRRRFAAGSNLRAWLYRIATNVCRDMLRTRKRRPVVGGGAEVPWLTPYPDTLLNELGDDPDGSVVDRETIELAFLIALQALPPRQRAALIARDVLGWPAAGTAELLDTSIGAANSAVQRARATMRTHLPEDRSQWAHDATAGEKELLARFIDAHERCDAQAAVAIAATDIRVTMPPYPWRHEGVAAIAPLLKRAFGEDRDGDWRLLPTMANRLPAAASYLRRRGDAEFRALKLDVLRMSGDQIAEITTFGTELFDRFGLPQTVATDDGGRR